MAVLLLLTGSGVVVGSAVIGRHRAQAAADLAALAAAGRVATGRESACGTANALATTMRATVVTCVVEELDVVVTVEVRVALGRWAGRMATASARAGPVP